MCRLVSVKSSEGIDINVADIKAVIIEQISALASECNKIDYIYIFGSALEECCNDKSDIDIAVISNVTRTNLFKAKDYNDFTRKLYKLDLEQDYDILQFNSLDALKNSKDLVCKDILEKGKLLYRRRGA